MRAPDSEHIPVPACLAGLRSNCCPFATLRRVGGFGVVQHGSHVLVSIALFRSALGMFVMKYSSLVLTTACRRSGRLRRELSAAVSGIVFGGDVDVRA